MCLWITAGKEIRGRPCISRRPSRVFKRRVRTRRAAHAATHGDPQALAKPDRQFGGVAVGACKEKTAKSCTSAVGKPRATGGGPEADLPPALHYEELISRLIRAVCQRVGLPSMLHNRTEGPS